MRRPLLMASLFTVFGLAGFVMAAPQAGTQVGADCLSAQQRDRELDEKIRQNEDAAMALPARTGFDGSIDRKRAQYLQNANILRRQRVDLRNMYPSCFGAPSPSVQQPPSRTNMPFGMSDVRWGDAPKPDMVFDRTTKEGFACYTRPVDPSKHSIGETSWCFVDGRFRSAFTETTRNSARIGIQTFSDSWGKPTERNGSFYWWSQDGFTAVSIFPVEKGGDKWVILFKDQEFWNARRAEQEKHDETSSTSSSAGTGIVVSTEGLILTNQHVVDSCPAIRVDGKKAVSMSEDKVADLAVLKVAGSFPAAAPLRKNRVRLGESVVAAGYPLPSLLSEGLKVSTGVISALSGPGNDSRYLQTTAPIQPGSSGGALLDQAGNVVGLSSMTLSTQALSKEIGGAIPQNLNFAISASMVRTFLDAAGVEYQSATTPENPAQTSSVEIAKQAGRYVVRVSCTR